MADANVRVVFQCDGPHLGMATTRDLLLEIAARGRVEDHYGVLGLEMEAGARNLIDSLPGSMLDYRTVGGR